MSAPATLTGTLTGRQLFLMAFGAAIGVGWIVVVGDWLSQAGPLGTVLGFAAGAAVLALVCLCYGEMAAALPVAGGEIVYCYESYGPRVAFAVGWFLALGYVAVTAFEVISVGWVGAALFPMLEGPTLLTIRGTELTAGSVGLGVGGTILLAWLHRRGVGMAARLQDWMTGLLVLASLAFITAGIGGGRIEHLTPLFQTDARGLILPGILAIFLTTPNWLGGFAFVPQLMEERAPGSPPRMAVYAMVMQVVLAAGFYSLVTIAAAMAVPWTELPGRPFPVVHAFRAAFQSDLLARVVLFAGFLGLVTTWNAVFLGASRVLFALGRAHMIPSRFGALDPRARTPTFAIAFVAVASVTGLALGRQSLLPLLNVVAATQAAAYVLVCIGIIRLRRRRPDLPRPYRVPGGIPMAVTAAAGSALALGLAIIAPYHAAGSVPLEWWLLIGWALLGAGFWVAARPLRERLSASERRAIVLGGRVGDTP